MEPASTRASSAYAWYVVAVLFIVTTFSQFDRQLTALLASPLKQGLAIDDTQFSLLHGYAFAITYSVLGVPFGRMVDRSNRRNLILAGLIVWSVTTVLAAFAQTFWQLVVARMGVGIGEAVLAPAAYSMIADLFDAKRRGRATGIYYASLAVGSGASFILGGWLLGAIPSGGVALGELAFAKWQAMFLYAGLPGLVIALLVLTIAEPARQDVQRQAGATIREFASHIWARKAAFLRLFTIPAVLAVVGYGTLGWAPSVMERRFGMSPVQSGPIIGLLVIASGMAGPPFAGWLSDRWSARNAVGARLRVIMVACAILAPASVWPLLPTPGLCLAGLGVSLLMLASAQSAMPVALQEVVFNDMRGQLVALNLLIAGLVGIGFGPTSVALITDHVFRSEAMLPWSLAIIAVPASILGGWVGWSGLRPYQAVLDERRALG